MSPGCGAALRLIELARWAPSGDNTQPWRFEILAPDHLVVHGFDTRGHCVYDLDGHPSQIAIGALIETLHIAASEQALQLNLSRRNDRPDTQPTFDVRLHHAPNRTPDPLLPAIPRRSVYRRPMQTRPLTEQEVLTLEQALPQGYTLKWYGTPLQRWKMAGLMFANAKLRLTMREAYEVHRSIIDWGERFSPDKVPDQALGVDSLTLRIMHWGMRDWSRIAFMNRWLAGTLAPRLQMDWLPSMMCAAHLCIVSPRAPVTIDDYIDAGRAVQRLWLTATTLGLQHQPEMTPLIFARYVRDGLCFSDNSAAQTLAEQLTDISNRAIGTDLPRTVWLGRIGAAPCAPARSLRHDIDSLQSPPHSKLRRNS